MEGSKILRGRGAVVKLTGDKGNVVGQLIAATDVETEHILPVPLGGGR